jgi:hypothetical protein
VKSLGNRDRAFSRKLFILLFVTLTEAKSSANGEEMLRCTQHNKNITVLEKAPKTENCYLDTVCDPPYNDRTPRGLYLTVYFGFSIYRVGANG